MSFAEVLVLGILLKSTWEDIRTLSVSIDWLLFGWLVVGLWSVAHGRWLQVIVLAAITLWGLGYGRGFLAWFFLPIFPYWPVLLAGAGAREGLLGEGDVLALSLASLLSPVVGWFSLGGLLLWAWWQRRAGRLWTPGLPGMFWGLAVYLLLAMGGSWHYG